MMRRRHLLAAPALFAPAIARAQTRMLRFVPADDLGWFDPTFWPFVETRNHSLMVYDMLFGLDAAGRPQPQMAEGHEIADNGRTWRIRLREGLKFHDNTPVRARDCIASIRRWGGHAMMGKSLLAATSDIEAEDDRTLVFRLLRPFPNLAKALGERSMQVCAIMPEWLAEGSDLQPITTVVGSGPFRFVPEERQPGRRLVYARFADYVPRPSGTPSFHAGPKVAHFDRVEWITMADPAAALAALTRGDVDWWEAPPPAAQTAIAEERHLALRVHDPVGYIATMRMNHLVPPFDNPAIRRAVLLAVDQAAIMAAVAGPAEPRRASGYFAPASPLATPLPAGSFGANPERAKAALLAAGYRGEALAVLAISDVPASRAVADAGVAMLRAMGFAVEVTMVRLRQLVPRLLRQQPAGAGGWNVVFGYWPAHDHWNPGIHRYLRGEGAAGEIGWPASPGLEALRRLWLATGDGDMLKIIAADMQALALLDVPYVPLGQWARPTAYAANLTGMLDGPPIFWNLRRDPG